MMEIGKDRFGNPLTKLDAKIVAEFDENEGIVIPEPPFELEGITLVWQKDVRLEAYQRSSLRNLPDEPYVAGIVIDNEVVCRSWDELRHAMEPVITDFPKFLRENPISWASVPFLLLPNEFIRCGGIEHRDSIELGNTSDTWDIEPTKLSEVTMNDEYLVAYATCIDPNDENNWRCEEAVLTISSMNVAKAVVGYCPSDESFDVAIKFDWEWPLLETLPSSIVVAQVLRLRFELGYNENGELLATVINRETRTSISNVEIGELKQAATEVGVSLEKQLDVSILSRMDFARFLWSWLLRQRSDVERAMILVNPKICFSVERFGRWNLAEIELMFPIRRDEFFTFHLAEGVTYDQRHRGRQEFKCVRVDVNLNNGDTRVTIV